MRLFSTLILTLFVLLAPAHTALAADHTVGASTGGWDFTTIAAALAGSAPGDTVTVQADTVHIAEFATLHHNMLLRGATEDHTLYIVESDTIGAAVNSAVIVDSTATIRDIHFRTDENLTTNYGFIRANFNTTDLTVVNCEFNCVCAANKGPSAIKAASAARVVIRSSRFEDCSSTGSNKPGVIEFIPGTNDDVIIRDSQFINCRANNFGIVYIAFGATDADTLLFADCLFTRNRTTSDGAVVGLAINAEKYLQIERCTFNDNECGTGADGTFGAWLDISDGGIDLTQVNVVGGDSTALATAGVLRNVSKLNVYGTTQDYIAPYVSGTATDTFHVDPAYLSKAASPDRWDYRGSQSDLVTNAIGHIDLTATRWYTDPTGTVLSADGTSAQPFASIAAMQGLSNQDTLTVGTGDYAEAVTCTLGTAVGRYGLTVAGAGGNPRDCRIVSSADIALYALAGSSVVRNLKFTAADSVALDTSSRGFISLMGNDYNDTLAFRNCVVESLTRAGGYTDNDGFAVVSHGLGTSTLASLFINEISDTLYTGTDAHTGSAIMVRPSGSGFSVVDSCIIANVRSGMPVHFVGVEDKLSWRYNLMVDCDASGADVEEAVMRLCGNKAAGTPEFRFTYSTWYDCNNAVDSLGIIGLHDLDLCVIDHCVFSGSTKCIENYGTAADDVDSLAHCNSYGAPFLKASDLSGTGVDTLHLPPEYNCLNATTDCYRANAPELETCADGSFMGWLRGVQRRGRPVALGIGRRRGRR